MSLRLKTILGIAFIEGVLLVLLVVNAQRHLRESNIEQFHNRATTSATLFASATRNAVIATDLAMLDNFVLDVLRNPDLTYARVLGQGQVVLAEAGDQAALARPFVADHSINHIDDNLYDVSAVVEEAGIEFGSVELGFDSSSIGNVLSESRNTLMVLAGIEMLLVALFSWLLGTFLTRQLDDLRQGASEIARGNFGYFIPTRGRDELAQTADAFNVMSENLQHSELRRTAYLQSPLQAVLTLDQTGGVTEVNGAAEILLLQGREEIVGQHVTDVLVPTSGSHPLAGIWQDSTQSMPPMVNTLHESEFKRSDDVEFNCEWHITTVSTQSETLYVIFAANIDERKQVERELVESRQTALAANAAKTEFLGNMTHELRTPLQGIIGFSDLGVSRSEKLSPAKSKKYFSTIRDSASTLLSLVNNLLDLTKMEAGKMEFTLARDDLAACLDSTIAELSGTAEVNKLDLKFERDTHLPCVFDSARMAQVVRNLVGNAIKFSPAASTIAVTARLDRQLGHLQVTVSDSGIGIPEGEEQLIFERFSQSTATKTAAGGTGLGLPICREIIDHHKGRIWVENNPGGGASFHFTLPADLQESDHNEEPLLLAS